MRRALKVGGLIFLLVVVVAVLWVWGTVRGAAPRLAGVHELSGLGYVVEVERDAAGVPRIYARDSVDAMRTLGFLHAQERFFQMDLLRRRSAGELAELIGAPAINADKRVRVHRLRARAGVALQHADAQTKAELAAYVEGVNAGLELVRPLEYRLLRIPPEPWTAEDSYLAIFTMYLNLQDENGALDSARGVMRDTLPAAAVEFLLPAGSEWDAPLIGEAYATPAIPGADVWSVSEGAGAEAEAAALDPSLEALSLIGSNNWAVAGTRTASGRAIMANDMHLGHGMPNIWYRAWLRWKIDGEDRTMSGVTLPGVPAVVAGSNGRIAWGFTNSQGDWTDLIELEFEDGSETRYRTPDGYAELATFEEVVRIKGGGEETVVVEETIWGPVIDTDHRGVRRAVRWIAHDPEGVSLSLTRLAETSTLEQAIHAAHRAGIPTQNFVVAADDGRIGWTLAGPVPDRFGHDGRFPISWANGNHGWDGHLTGDRLPRLIDPPSGIIWTANNRTMDGRDLAVMGDGGYATGARARQIRDGLLAIEEATPEDMLTLQLDDRALFLERWRDLLLEVLENQTPPGLEELKKQVETTWTGHASVDSVAYRMVRGWRGEVMQRVFDPLTEPCRRVDPDFSYRGRYEGPLWRLLEERPAHLLDPKYADWNALLVEAAHGIVDYFTEDPTDSLDGLTWGERNRVVFQHPMSSAIPGPLQKYFDIETESLPGDSWMPRVQSTGWGASERFAVSPGHEENGLFQMPGGQSGHPFAPYYRTGHRAWADGTPAPFLPGETRWKLTLHRGN